MLIQMVYPVVKSTLKGVWIDVWGKKKFILNDARKQWASPSPEKALESYQARKRRQIGILEHQLNRAKIALTLLPELHKDLGYLDSLYDT